MTAPEIGVFLSAARSLKIPARYVSGYLHKAGEVEQEAGHAWAEVWLAGHWHSVDVALQCPDADPDSVQLAAAGLVTQEGGVDDHERAPAHRLTRFPAFEDPVERVVPGQRDRGQHDGEPEQHPPQ